jgi:hypothetical protein
VKFQNGEFDHIFDKQAKADQEAKINSGRQSFFLYIQKLQLINQVIE